MLDCETTPRVAAISLERGSGVANEPMNVDWTRVDWEDLVPRLLHLAASRLSRLVWRGARAGAPGMADAEDFVSAAITKTIEGVRVWNRETCSLFEHLAGVIVSDINHAAESAENRRTSADPTACNGVEHADPAADPERIAAWRSEEEHLLHHLWDVDPRIGRLAELILIHDLRETAALSSELGLVPTEVLNLRKRMKRAILKYLSEEGE